MVGINANWRGCAWPEGAASALLYQVVAMGMARCDQIILVFKQKGRNLNFYMQHPNFYYWRRVQINKIYGPNKIPPVFSLQCRVYEASILLLHVTGDAFSRVSPLRQCGDQSYTSQLWDSLYCVPLVVAGKTHVEMTPPTDPSFT